MNNWTARTEQLSVLPLLEALTRAKMQLDAIRPLPQDVEGRVMQKIRLEWNYHSNAIEGNKLTFGETYSFLMYGLTAKGKPLKDHLDIRGHNEAVKFLTSIIKDDRDLTESEIRELHAMILVESYKSTAQTPDGQAVSKTIRIGAYKQMPNHVLTTTGEIHYYDNPEDVPILMGELVTWYNVARKNEAIHPSVLAAFFHHRFVAIHPFDDGNGRLARILMNLILMQKGYPPAVVKVKERTDYYAALAQADKNEYQAIIEFVAESVLDSINLYLKAAKGENIEEDEDLNKEIALFKGSFEKTYSFKSPENMLKIFDEVLQPFVKLSEVRFADFNGLFLQRDIQYFYAINGFTIEYNGIDRYIEPESDNFSPEILPRIINNNFDIIGLHSHWFDFNKLQTIQKFTSTLRIHFERLGYKIEAYSQILLNKMYDDVVNDYEFQRVANQWLRLIFEDLKEQVEQAKK